MNGAHRLILRFLLTLLALVWAPAILATWNFSAQPPDTGKALLRESLRMVPELSPASTVFLGEADAGEIDAVRKSNSSSPTKRLQIGIGRDVANRPEAASASLRWESVPGGMAAHWLVSSSGARSLRIGLDVGSLAPSAEIRFAGDAGAGTVYGPFSMTEIPVGQEATWWSPVLEGESAVVEVFIGDGASHADVSLAIAQVSHLFASPVDRNVDMLAKAAGACEVDIACRSGSDHALDDVGHAVAKMTFSDGQGGGTFLCTGTLLNPIGGSFTPYFHSANHCISTQASASTLTTHWFYDASSCRSGTASSDYVQLTGGAALLYNNLDTDVLFLRLNRTPPAGAIWAGWDSATLGTGVALTAVHHPAGDLKKVSLGSMGGFSGYGGTAGDSYVISLWNSTATGVVEGGSSGSGIFTLVGSDYRFRGGLKGGPSSCSATGINLRDYYSRFDRAYPFLAQYLNPATSCSYTLSPSSQSVGAGASSGSFGVTTGAGCAWTAGSNASWIATSSSGTGSGTVQYSVAANTGSTARTGTVAVGGRSFTLTQAGQVGGGTTTSLIANGGFESGTSSWTQTATTNQAIIVADAAAAHSGSWYAWLGGNLSATDMVYQAVTIPADATQATPRFWYRISTNESPSSTAYDTMVVSVNSTSTGAVLATLASFSNLGTTSGWVQSQAYDLSAFRGQRVWIVFGAVNDFSDSTSFRIDDITFTATTTGGATEPNYTALWYNAPAESESGWGINLNHQGAIMFATLFTYDSTGAPMWLFMSRGDRQADGVTFTGPLYRATGPVFNAVPFTSITGANLTQVGTMSVTFSSVDSATLRYSVNGAQVTKTIQRQVFGSRPANCTNTTGSRASLTNYQDLWWNAPADSESGWGINITHQDNTLFATLFTYGADGRDLWLFMSGGPRQSDGSYLGELYIANGPAFNAQPFTPITIANLTQVGTMRFRFSDGEHGTLTYSVNGAVVTKQIIRQVFWSPLPSCS